MTETLVEALARAIARTYYDNSFYRNADGTRTTDSAALAMLERKIDEGWLFWSEHARAALSELNRLGYAVVPKEPTEKMCDAAFNVEIWDEPIYDWKAKECWQAMCAAAPKVGE